MLWNHHISTLEAWTLIGGFMLLIGWSIWSALRSKGDYLEQETGYELSSQRMSQKSSIFWLFTGLVLLIISSRILVWGAVEIAQQLGVSDLLIGLTIVTLGTSLP